MAKSNLQQFNMRLCCSILMPRWSCIPLAPQKSNAGSLQLSAMLLAAAMRFCGGHW